jgi:hypothetical protein
VSCQDFGGVALAKAMATIDSQTVRAIDSATVSEYTTVGVGVKGDQYYAGLASKVGVDKYANNYALHQYWKINYTTYETSGHGNRSAELGVYDSYYINNNTDRILTDHPSLLQTTSVTIPGYYNANYSDRQSLYNNATEMKYTFTEPRSIVQLFIGGPQDIGINFNGGFQDLTVSYSDDNSTWTQLGSVIKNKDKIFEYHEGRNSEYWVQSHQYVNDEWVYTGSYHRSDGVDGFHSTDSNDYLKPFEDPFAYIQESTLTTSTLQWTDKFPMYLHMDASRATTVSAGSTTLAAGGVVDQVSGTPFSYFGTTPVLHENRGIHMNGGHLYLNFGFYSTKIGPPATTGMNTTVMCVAQQLGDSTMQTMFAWNTNQSVKYNIMRMGDDGADTYQEMTVSDFNRVSGNDGNRKYDSSGDLETRIYVGTVEHNVNSADPNSFDQTVTLRVYDDTGQNVFDGQSDSRTVSYADIDISYVFTNSRYVQLGGYGGSNHSTNLTMKELKWFQNKLSPEEEAAQVSAMAAKWGPPPYSEEWVLVARDYKGTADFAQYQNSAGDFGDDSVLATAYSRFYSLYSSDTGAGDFNDTEIKSRGYYEFKWIPYFTSPVTNANRVDPETDTLYDNPGTTVERYIQWTQTGNPLKTNTGSSGVIPGFSLIDQQNADVTVGTSENQFNGLALSDHPTSAILDGNGEVNNWYYACGTVSTWAIPWDKTGVNDTITSSELYVRKITETAAPAPATEGWRLFVRDRPNSDDFQYYASAAGDFGDKDTNLHEPYSMMNSFYAGKEGFTDADIKTDGYYLFRWNFYLDTITAANRIDPNTGSRGTNWLQWTQTNNPFTEPRAGFANNSSGSDINTGSGSYIARELALSEVQSSAALDATSGGDWYWPLGTRTAHANNGIPVPSGSITGMTDDSLGPNGGTECWVWFGPKPNPSDLGTI